jgi:plasmid stabilization system protein ParE
MAYQIEISPTAVADIEGIFLWIKEDSPENAYRWVRGCYEIMLTLFKFSPALCFGDRK